MAKLTEADVRYIRDQVAAGAVQTHLAKELGVTKSLIGKIHKRLLWTHI
jgi:predicted transcriptional regulator